MVNWNEIDFNDCTDCGANDWNMFHEDEHDDPSDVEFAHFECLSCGKHARIFVEGSSVHKTGGMRM